MSEQRKVLIIGAGAGQLPAFHAAKQLGLIVVTADRNPSAPGMALADHALAIDTKDLATIVRVAQEAEVSGVLTLQSDVGVPAVGAVVDALALPGSGLQVAERCSNKILTRLCLKEHGVTQPAFEVAGGLVSAREAADRIGFPCVIKAPDSSGSRGVVKVAGPQDVESALVEAQKFTSGGKVLVEQFIEGIEFGAQGFCLEGECVLVLLHDDELSRPPFMIPIGHSMPSSLSVSQQAKALRSVVAAVSALGIEHGPSNIDLILGQDGEVYLVEVGVRIGATCLPELVELHTGIDWVAAGIQASLGQYPDLTPKRAVPSAAYILENSVDGIYRGFEAPEWVAGHPGIVEWELTVSPGDRVSMFRKGTDRIGKVVTRAATADRAVALANRFREELVLQVDPTGHGQ